MGKKLRKYIATFDYFDKVLIVSYSTTGGIYIIFLQVLLEFLQE